MAAEEEAKKQENGEQPELKMKKKQSSKVIDKEMFFTYHPRPSIISKLWKLTLEEGDDAAELQQKVEGVFAKGQYCYALNKS